MPVGFDSGFERLVYHRLRDDLKKLSLERDDCKLHSGRIPYMMQRHYTPDVVLANGIIIELKGGFFPREERQKMQWVAKSNPELDIRFVFGGKPHKRQGRGRLIPPLQWAKKHGFKCAVNWIPVSWLMEVPCNA